MRAMCVIHLQNVLAALCRAERSGFRALSRQPYHENALLPQLLVPRGESKRDGITRRWKALGAMLAKN